MSDELERVNCFYNQRGRDVGSEIWERNGNRERDVDRLRAPRRKQGGGWE